MRRGARARVWWCVARRTQARSSRAWRMVTSARVGVGVPLRARTGWRVSRGDLRTAPTAQGSQAASSRSGRGQQCGLIVMEHSPSRGGGTSREEWCASHASRSSRTTSSINGEHHPCYDGSRGVLPCEETTPSCCPSKALGAQTPGISSSRCVGAYPHRSRSASSRLRRLPPGGNIQQAGAVFPYCGEGRPHGQRRDRPPHVALERRIEAPGATARHTRRRTSRATTPRASSKARRPVACCRRCRSTARRFLGATRRAMRWVARVAGTVPSRAFVIDAQGAAAEGSPSSPHRHP